MAHTTTTSPSYNAIAALDNVNIPPYFTGTMPLIRDASTLFYRAGDKAEMIDFTQATDQQLAALAATCQPASFGVAKSNVLDESYRKAGKMDSSQFSAQFSPTSSGIMEGIRKSLFAGRTNDSIKVELYKLNVYGPGSFFKAHVDTPRSTSMVASLVVVLPTKHEGGSLLFRHSGSEFTFDSANAVATAGEGSPRAAFVAFYSDVEHEVSIVTSGYRVTLTYNLYLEKPDSPTLPESTIMADISNFCAETKTILKALLDDPNFLPQGGYMGFGLSHRYPFTTNTNLSMIEDSLKGTDAALAQICKDLNLIFQLRAVYADEDEEDAWALVDKFPRFDADSVQDHSIIACLNRGGYDAEFVFDVLKRSSYEAFRDTAYPILWVRPLASVNQFETAYIRYRNEPSLDYAYGDVCLVADVLSARKRAQGHLGALGKRTNFECYAISFSATN